MFHLPDSLAISMAFDVFVLPQAAESEVRGIISIEDPDTFLRLTTPEIIHCNIQMSTILSIQSSKRVLIWITINIFFLINIVYALTFVFPYNSMWAYQINFFKKQAWHLLNQKHISYFVVQLMKHITWKKMVLKQIWYH